MTDETIEAPPMVPVKSIFRAVTRGLRVVRGEGTDRSCPSCQGTGWKIVAGAAHDHAERCCLPPLTDRLVAMGVPAIDAESRLDALPEWVASANPELSAIGEALKEWTAGASGADLALWGPVGTGKSCLAAGVVAECLTRRIRVGYVSFPAWFTRVRSSYGRGDAERETDLMAEIASGAALVADEFGTRGGWTDNAVDLLEQAFQARTANRRRSLLTTNLSPDEVRERSPRLWSRLCRFEWLAIEGPDLRAADPTRGRNA